MTAEELLEKALTFYADRKHFSAPGIDLEPHHTHISRTFILDKVETGSIAREALKSRPRCNCHLHYHQVCDICQNIVANGRDNDAEEIANNPSEKEWLAVKNQLLSKDKDIAELTRRLDESISNTNTQSSRATFHLLQVRHLAASLQEADAAMTMHPGEHHEAVSLGLDIIREALRWKNSLYKQGV